MNNTTVYRVISIKGDEVKATIIRNIKGNEHGLHSTVTWNLHYILNNRCNFDFPLYDTPLYKAIEGIE
jgi:hypothetical protein